MRRRNPSLPGGQRAWFHGTPMLKSVLRHGLVLSKAGTGYGAEDVPAEGGIYFARQVYMAIDAAAQTAAKIDNDGGTSNPGVVKVDLSGMDVLPDEDYEHHPVWKTIPAIRTMSPISRARILWYFDWEVVGHWLIKVRFDGPTQPTEKEIGDVARLLREYGDEVEVSLR